MGSQFGLGGRGEQRLRELAGLDQSGRQRDAAHGAGLLVVDQPGAGQVATGHGLDGHHLEFLDHEGAAEHLFGDALVVGRACQVVGGLDVVEEEHAHRGQNAALVGNLAVEDVVEGRDAIGGDKQQVPVVDSIQLANLAAGQMLIVGQSGAHRASLSGSIWCMSSRFIPTPPRRPAWWAS